MSRGNESGASPQLGVVTLCLTIVAVLWAALIFDAGRSEKAAINQARGDASNLAMAFRENIKRTVSAIDQLMITIIAENDRIRRRVAHSRMGQKLAGAARCQFANRECWTRRNHGHLKYRSH